MLASPQTALLAFYEFWAQMPNWNMKNALLGVAGLSSAIAVQAQSCPDYTTYAQVGYGLEGSLDM